MNTVIQAALQLRKDVQGGESGSCKGPGARTRLVPISGLQGLCGSVQSLRRVRLFTTSWTAAGQASLSITNSRSLLKLMSIQLMMPSNHLIRCFAPAKEKKNAVLRCSVSGPSQSRAVRLSGEVENLDRTSLASPLL